jgi:2-methylcitrate dehydratase PrpD
MSTAEELALRLERLRATGLPAAAREAAIRCLLDLLAAAAAGLADRGASVVRQVALAQFGPGHSGLWFSDAGAMAAGAVLANSAAASALDLDDGYRLARGHPGAAAIPAAWAAMRWDADPGADELLGAVVAGYEAGVRMAMGRLSYAPSGAWSPYAAIAAAAHGRGCDTGTVAAAFGIAAQCAPGLPGLAGIVGSDVKEGIPWGTLTGWMALELARAGHTGPQQIFDDPALFAAERIIGDRDCLPLIDGSYFKPYACCRHIHPALDALLDLLGRHALHARDLDRIEVQTYTATFNLANRAAPSNLVEAQYSAPYCVALAAWRGSSALVPMVEGDLRDVQVLDLAARVTLVRHDDLDSGFPARSAARVVLIDRAGRRYASPTTEPRGDPARALSWADLEQKFLQASRHTLTPPRQRELLRAFDPLRAGDPGPLRAALR